MQLTISQYSIKNVANLSYVTIEEILKLIKNDEGLKVSTEQLRSLVGKEQDDYKLNQLPYVIFGGTFKERKDV